VKDSRYAALFDIALESCDHANPSERKRRARSAANRAVHVLDTAMQLI
jgi:hypothetical protein